MNEGVSLSCLRTSALWAAVVLLVHITFSAGPHDSPVVLTLSKVETHPVAVGDSTHVRVTLKIARGYHVNANPAASDFYIPLEVKLSDTGGIHVGTTRYPKGKKWRLQGTDEDLLVYGGTVTVDLPVVIAKEAKIGEQVLQGSVDYQACTDEMCLIPDSLPLSIKVTIQKPAS